MSAENKKAFHISEVLTFHTGTMMVFDDELTKLNGETDDVILQDGTARARWKTNLTPMIELASRLGGQDLWIDRETGNYNGEAMAFLMPEARKNLLQQMPWLNDVNAPHIPAGTEDKETFLRDWVMAHAATHGEWLDIKQAPPRPMPITSVLSRGPRLH